MTLEGVSVASIKQFCNKSFISTRASKEYFGELVTKTVDEATLLRLLILSILYLYI